MYLPYIGSDGFNPVSKMGGWVIIRRRRSKCEPFDLSLGLGLGLGRGQLLQLSKRETGPVQLRRCSVAQIDPT